MFSTRRKKEVLPYSAFSAPPSVPQPSDAAKANRRISMFFGAGNDLSDAQTASASPAQKLKNFIKRSKSKWTLRKDGEDSFGGAKLQTQIYLDAPLGYSHSQQQSYAHTQCLNTGTQSWKPHEHPIASQNNSFTHTFNHRPSTPHTPDLMRSSYATSSDSRPVSSSDLYNNQHSFDFTDRPATSYTLSRSDPTQEISVQNNALDTARSVSAPPQLTLDVDSTLDFDTTLDFTVTNDSTFSDVLRPDHTDTKNFDSAVESKSPPNQIPEDDNDAFKFALPPARKRYNRRESNTWHSVSSALKELDRVGESFDSSKDNQKRKSQSQRSETPTPATTQSSATVSPQSLDTPRRNSRIVSPLPPSFAKPPLSPSLKKQERQQSFPTTDTYYHPKPPLSPTKKQDRRQSSYSTTSTPSFTDPTYLHQTPIQTPIMYIPVSFIPSRPTTPTPSRKSKSSIATSTKRKSISQQQDNLDDTPLSHLAHTHKQQTVEKFMNNDTDVLTFLHGDPNLSGVIDAIRRPEVVEMSPAEIKAFRKGQRDERRRSQRMSGNWGGAFVQPQMNVVGNRASQVVLPTPHVMYATQPVGYAHPGMFVPQNSGLALNPYHGGRSEAENGRRVAQGGKNGSSWWA